MALSSSSVSALSVWRCHRLNALLLRSEGWLSVCVCVCARVCACVCVHTHTYVFRMCFTFQNLHWQHACFFKWVRACVCVVERVHSTKMCACKCTGRVAGASLNKGSALFWTISSAKKDISSSISSTTCPPSLHCADNSIIPPCQVFFASQTSLFMSSVTSLVTDKAAL